MKKKRINLREIVTLSIGTGMFVLGLCALIYVSNDIVPDRSKLPANVWGTISDWMMILITIVTAVLLLLTLKSQKKVQDDQRLMFQLEQKKHRNSIKPAFDIKIEYRGCWSNIEDGTPYNIYGMEVESYQATIFSIELTQESDFTLPAFYSKKWNHVYPGKSDLELHTARNISSDIPLYGGVILKYQDKEYNNYEMKIFFSVAQKDSVDELLVNMKFISDRFIGNDLLT